MESAVDIEKMKVGIWVSEVSSDARGYCLSGEALAKNLGFGGKKASFSGRLWAISPNGMLEEFQATIGGEMIGSGGFRWRIDDVPELNPPFLLSTSNSFTVMDIGLIHLEQMTKLMQLRHVRYRDWDCISIRINGTPGIIQNSQDFPNSTQLWLISSGISKPESLEASFSIDEFDAPFENLAKASRVQN